MEPYLPCCAGSVQAKFAPSAPAAEPSRASPLMTEVSPSVTSCEKLPIIGTSSTTFTVMVLSTSVPSISVTVTVRSWEISSMPEPLCSVVLPLSS